MNAAIKWNEIAEKWRPVFCYFILFYFILLQMDEPLYNLARNTY